MKITSIAFALFLCAALRGAEPPTEGSPAWIVEWFFTQATFPEPERYYTGEMRQHLTNPPMGAYVPPGYVHAISVLSESHDASVYRFTYSNSPRAGDWYAFLVREDEVWKLSAVRTLAIPRFVHELRDRLRAQESRSETEELELRKMDLMFSSDAKLKAYLTERITAFQAIAERVLSGETNADLQAEADELRIDHLSITKDGLVHLIIGGVLDNSVGFIFVPDGKARPLMSEEDFILVDAVRDGWFLVKTT